MQKTCVVRNPRPSAPRRRRPRGPGTMPPWKQRLQLMAAWRGCLVSTGGDMGCGLWRRWWQAGGCRLVQVGPPSQCVLPRGPVEAASSSQLVLVHVVQEVKGSPQEAACLAPPWSARVAEHTCACQGNGTHSWLPCHLTYDSNRRLLTPAAPGCLRLGMQAVPPAACRQAVRTTGRLTVASAAATGRAAAASLLPTVTPRQGGAAT